MPDSALVAVHDAETVQLPQSVNPVAGTERHAGCVCGSVTDGATVATLRAPAPP